MGNIGSEIASEFRSDEDIVMGRYHVHKAPQKEAKKAKELSIKKQLKRKQIEAKKRQMIEFIHQQQLLAQVDQNLEQEETKETKANQSYTAQVLALQASYDGEPEPLERTQLPYLKDPKEMGSAWDIIKNSIGKDVTTLTVPVTFNEPIGML